MTYIVGGTIGTIVIIGIIVIVQYKRKHRRSDEFVFKGYGAQKLPDTDAFKGYSAFNPPKGK